LSHASSGILSSRRRVWFRYPEPEGEDLDVDHLFVAELVSDPVQALVWVLVVAKERQEMQVS
jgi:hypothetical protein